MADKLMTLRKAAAQLRDLENEIEDLENLLKDRKKKLEELRHQKLPDMFMEVGIDALSLPKDGNHQACDFTLKPYYRANIAVAWPAAKREIAFKHLEKCGFGDVIRRTYRINMERGEKILAGRLEKGLEKLGLSYSANLDVPHTTLTALLREQFEAGNKTLDLEKIGGTAGMIVTLK